MRFVRSERASAAVFSESVDARRASRDDPEFIEILPDDVKLVALLDKERHGIKGLLMHGVGRVGHPRQNICINQIVHSPRPA